MRRKISRVYNWLAQLILDTPVKDPMSGFIVAKRHVWNSIPLTNDYKIGCCLIRKGRDGFFFIGELPIHFHKRKEGKSKAKLSTAFKTLWLISQLRLRS